MRNREFRIEEIWPKGFGFQCDEPLSMNRPIGARAARPRDLPPLPKVRASRPRSSRAGSWSQCAPILAWGLSTNHRLPKETKDDKRVPIFLVFSFLSANRQWFVPPMHARKAWGGSMNWHREPRATPSAARPRLRGVGKNDTSGRCGRAAGELARGPITKGSNVAIILRWFAVLNTLFTSGGGCRGRLASGKELQLEASHRQFLSRRWQPVFQNLVVCRCFRFSTPVSRLTVAPAV